MYVVILAGGGGTRLWPLSRPERPKPFLPLVDDRDAPPADRRPDPPLVDETDIFCVADRRYGQLVRDQVPGRRADRRADRPQHRRRDRPRQRGHRPARRRGDGRPAGRPLDRRRGRLPRRAPAVAAEQLATRRVRRSSEPLVTLGVRPTFPSTDYGYLRPGHDARRRRSTASGPTRSSGFEEKPTEARARELINLPGVAWNAGMFAWQRGAIRAALEKYTPLPMLDRPGGRLGPRRSPTPTSGSRPISIDRAVMESAAADHQRRHGRDGRRLERPRQLDRRSSAAIAGDRSTGRPVGSSSPARRSRSAPTT